MNYIFNKKERFYDYFPHLPILRMKMDFGLGYYEQGYIRKEIQNVIRNAYDHLVTAHDLKHVAIYPEIGDEFDEKFYNELKINTQRVFRNSRTWLFLDDLMPENGEDDDGVLYLKLTASVGGDIQREDGEGPVKLRQAFVKLINFDLDALNGQELLYLTKIS